MGGERFDERLGFWAKGGGLCMQMQAQISVIHAGSPVVQILYKTYVQNVQYLQHRLFFSHPALHPCIRLILLAKRSSPCSKPS